MSSNLYNDFVRVVKNGKMSKDAISPFLNVNSDGDRINHILEVEVANSESYSTGNKAGVVAKGYFDGCTVSGGTSEIAGLFAILKHKATLSGGAKASVASFHVHSASTGTVERGISLFGNTTNALFFSGTHSYFAEFLTGSECGYASGSLADTDSADIKCDAKIKLNVAGTDMYIPVYNG